VRARYHVTCAVKAIADAAREAGTVITARHVMTSGQRTAVISVSRTFINVYNVLYYN